VEPGIERRSRGSREGARDREKELGIDRIKELGRRGVVFLVWLATPLA
jgi:hypothetical protein